MEKEFVPVELAVKLKQLGFDEPCFGFYNEFDNNKIALGLADGINKAPIFSQAFRFFREKYPNIDFGFGRVNDGTTAHHYHINLQWQFFNGTYEEAELACVEKLIEIVELKQQ